MSTREISNLNYVRATLTITRDNASREFDDSHILLIRIDMQMQIEGSIIHGVVQPIDRC